MRRDPSLHSLSHQHQHGLALCVIIRRTLDADESEGARRDLAEKVRAAWEAELEAHFAVEEGVLFPVVRRRIDDPRLVDRLIGEHRELEGLVGDVLSEAAAPRLRALAKLLHDHIRTEERTLFEQIQEQLDSEELEALGRKVEASLAKTCPAGRGLPWAPVID